MKRALSVLIALVVVAYVAAIFVPFDPDERRPGTRLSGELALDQNPDWSFLSERTKIWVETKTWYLIPHSVTTTSWVANGEFYVPCGRCDTKRWPKNVARDPRVRLKVDGQLYERNAVRITDPGELQRVVGEGAGDFAVFRMEPRSA